MGIMTVAVVLFQGILREVIGVCRCMFVHLCVLVCVYTNEAAEAPLLERLENPFSSLVPVYHSNTNHLDSCEWH